MMRGLDLSDPLRTLRLIEWYKEEQQEKFLRTILLVKAMTMQPTPASAQEVSQALEMWRQSIFPTDKDNEQLIEDCKEQLEGMEDMELEVKPLHMPWRDP